MSEATLERPIRCLTRSCTLRGMHPCQVMASGMKEGGELIERQRNNAQGCHVPPYVGLGPKGEEKEVTQGLQMWRTTFT
jgi:hypothetical protein